MSAATVPRRKQAKPQRLATSASNEEEEVIQSKRLRSSAPLSIEEQFKKQFSQSIEAHLLQKAKQAVAQFNNQSSNISPLDHTNFFSLANSLKQEQEGQINEEEEESAGRKSTSPGAVELLLPTAATASNSNGVVSRSGNFLLDSLGTQQFLQLYNNALAQSAQQQQKEEDENHREASQRNESGSTTTTSCLLSPPNSSFNDVASSTASSSANGDRFACPVADCSQHFSNCALQILHLSGEHREVRAFHCASCGERFGDLNKVRKHDCQREEILQRCSSSNGNSLEDKEMDEDNRAVSEPPRFEGPWIDIRLTEKHDNSTWSNQPVNESLDRPPLLMNEANESLLANVFDLGPDGLKEMGLLAMRRQNAVNHLSFGQPTFAPTIPNFVPPHASSSTPPRGQRQITPEDDWEAMMEISTTDESEKIRALVGDKALPVTDPNQCLLCRRVLSCKSALQMHYRTHTGERPFKCKICQRAFTTKGNLKTHMGVHRSKHSSLRGIGQSTSSSLNSPTGSLNHQCPICQKRFISPHLLQQHVHEHTSQLTNRSNELLPPTAHLAQLFNSNSNNSSADKTQMLPQSTPSAGFPPLPFLHPNFLQFGGMINPFMSNPAQFAQSLMQQSQKKFEDEKRKGESEQSNGSDLLASLGFPPFKMPRLDTDLREGEKRKEEERKADEQSSSTSATPQPCKLSHEIPSLEQKTLDLRPPTLVAQSPKPEGQSPTTSKQKIEENPLEAIQKMWAATEPSPPSRPPIQLSKHQCAVCFKHFSSSSALQIHTRTHTGDKPFKCEICSRAFTTRGNLKVHMSTHSYQTSPSRRGRRIFDFGTESLLRAAQQGGNPFANSSQPNTPAAVPNLGTPPFGFPAMSFPPFLAAMMSSLSNKEETNQLVGQSSDAAAQMSAMLWLFKTVCSVCQKVCSSPNELQEHLKAHMENGSVEAKENSN